MSGSDGTSGTTLTIIEDGLLAGSPPPEESSSVVEDENLTASKDPSESESQGQTISEASSDYDSPTHIRYVESQDGRRRRQGRLLTLQGASNRPSNGPVEVDVFMYFNVPNFLAWKHVQERSGSVILSLPQVLQNCDFDWTLECRDTQFSIAQGVRALVNATTKTSASNNGEEWQFPFAIVGALYSSVSIPTNMLGQAYGLPQISAASTSAALDNAPYFARTIPTNSAEALALMLYYKSIGITHMACLYVRDAWGNSYVAYLQNAAEQLGIQVAAFAYDDGNQASIQSALKQLKQSGFRHVYAIMFSWRPILEEAMDLEVIGPPGNYSWIGAEMVEWTADTLEFNRSNPRDLRMAHALRGAGSLQLDGGYNERFDNAMREFSNNRTLQEEFIQSYAPEDRHIFDHYKFSYVVDHFYQKAAYDATYSLAIAACKTPGIFTGPELYETLLQLEFEGVTGKVAFDSSTGTRKADSVTVRVGNVFWSEERSDEDFIRLGSNLAVTITQGDVEQVLPWIYYDNSTSAPSALPPIEVDYNFIPLGAQIVGWVLGGFVVCLSMGLIFWTLHNRNIFVVKAGQPLFLSQLCIGTMITALAVIPMSRQGTEPSPSLDAACMAVPWLIFLGFVITFSGIFSKTWRLNQLMNSGMGMRRIEVQAKDVLGPFVVLMTINIAMMLSWTLVSPMQYERIGGNDVDRFGRALESHGQCKSPDNTYLYFLIPIILFDFLGVLTATYQSYKARDLPTTLSESSHLALAMASLLETFLLGGPLYFMVMDNPTASYLVGSCLLCLASISVLLPIFVPKYQNRRMAASRAEPVVSSTIRRSRNKRSHVSETITASVADAVPKRGRMFIVRTSTNNQQHVHSNDHSSNAAGSFAVGDSSHRDHSNRSHDHSTNSTPQSKFQEHTWQSNGVATRVRWGPAICEAADF